MALRPCTWCDRDFTPRNPRQRCCTPSCAQTLRQTLRRQAPDYQPPVSSGWRKHPNGHVDSEHVRLKKQLLPAAIGTPCPMCGRVMHQTQRLALDHIKARALGGLTVRSNVRITHYECNHRAGSRLGAVIQQRRRQATIR